MENANNSKKNESFADLLEESFAKINFTNGILNILKLEAVGEALAVSIDGWIDKKNDNLQIHGTMAPATLLTKIFEQIPILSELITGKDKAGPASG